MCRHPSVCRAQNTRTPLRIKATLLTVNVTLDTREKMEAPARSAVSTNTKKVWGQVLVRIVHQTRSLQLAASPILSANVMLGLQEQMEARARCASKAALIKLMWDLRGVLIVEQAHIHKLS